MTLADLFDRWLAYRRLLANLGTIAMSTLDNQEQVCRTLGRALGPTALAELRKSDVDIFVGTRLQTCAPVTVAGEMEVLTQILTYAVDEGLLATRPRLPTVSVPNVEKKLPADADFAWYLRTMAPRHADPLQFMCLTGLAPHELERLQVRDRDPVSGELLIGQREDFAVKQESRRRRIPLNKAATVIWLAWSIEQTSTAHPFPARDALQKAMRRHFLSRSDAPAGANGLTPKMMRKWFASKVANEASEKVLQALMGHAPGSPITRKHYVRSTDLERASAVEALGGQHGVH